MQTLVTIPPDELPVTLAEAKEYLKVDFSEDDELIERLISAVTDYAQKYTGLSFVTQTLITYNENWECSELPYGPHQEVKAVVRVNYDGTETDVLSGEYHVTGLNYFSLTCGFHYRLSSPWSERNRVKVTYTAGFGTALDVPDLIKLAILKNVAELYENRENSVIGTIVADLTTDSKDLLRGFKRHAFV